MLHIGELGKGVMHYAGLGPHSAWTLTDRRGEIKSIWKLFSEILPRLEQSAMFFGNGYFLIKRIDAYPSENWIRPSHIKLFLKDGLVKDGRLLQIVNCIDTVAKILHGKKVRIFSYIDLFEIFGQEKYDARKSGSEEMIRRGLFVNAKGFCRVAHQKRACKIHKDGRCIFVKDARILDKDRYPRKVYYCGKFNQKFEKERLALHAAGKINGTIGSCDNLCGFEI